MDGLSSVVLLVPSWGKQCGIAEYSRYVAQALRAGSHNVEIVSSIEAARIPLDRDRQCRLIVLHEFGLFDSLEPHCGGPVSARELCDFIADRIRLGQEIPWVVLHTLDISTHQCARKTDQIIASGARVFSTHPSVPTDLGVEHLKLGFIERAVRWAGGNIDATSIRDLTCVTFGFVNPAKGVSVVLAATQKFGFSLTAQ